VVLDPAAMGPRLERHFLASGSLPGGSVAACAIELVYYKPHRHCGVLYRATLRDRAAAETEEWVFGQAFAPEIGRQRFGYLEACLGDVRPACAALRDVAAAGYWDDLHIAVSLFPHDRKMPMVRRAADPEYVRHVLQTHPEAGEAMGGRATPVSIGFDRLKYMPGKRCVLRYHLGWGDSPERGRRRSFISKTYPDGGARQVFERLRGACDAWRARDPGIDVPRPLVALEDTHSNWVEDWGGTPLAAAFATGDGEAHIERAAALLAAIHRSRVDGLPAAPDRDEVLRTAVEALERYATDVPEHAKAMTELRQRIEREAPASLESTRVPIHGAFRAEQLLVRDGRITAIDFDALAFGDPLQDVAEFIASLRYLEVGMGRPRGELARAAAAFCEQYAALVPWRCDPDRIAWYAAGYTANKMHSTIKHLDLAAIARLIASGPSLIQQLFEAPR
jgi:hypothetical protein